MMTNAILLRIKMGLVFVFMESTDDNNKIAEFMFFFSANCLWWRW
ncbi:protein of unknown function, migth related with Nicotinamide mononucleotide transporter [Shewanella benthica]|uniref:Uncharacterized protein n=1 Tax=Shewanella benthica TaxID=43661 RepID=A0A330M051_9GAMM|nr:protein of unknown function, migth related with Nicotinamide mononucleotide transporter [Shewanella benthica]